MINSMRRGLVGVLVLSSFAWSASRSYVAFAQTPDEAQSTSWSKGAISHAQRMLSFPNPATTVQPAPFVIPSSEVDLDANGVVATSQPGGPTLTANNPFFQNLGTNGRTCFTCHQPQTGWTISAQSARDRFARSGGTDPLFRLVDGATCPSDDVSTAAARSQAYKLLLEKGLDSNRTPVTCRQSAIAVRDNGCQPIPTTARPIRVRVSPARLPASSRFTDARCRQPTWASSAQ